jgi:hypothetical protein
VSVSGAGVLSQWCSGVSYVFCIIDESIASDRSSLVQCPLLVNTYLFLEYITV